MKIELKASDFRRACAGLKYIINPKSPRELLQYICVKIISEDTVEFTGIDNAAYASYRFHADCVGAEGEYMLISPVTPPKGADYISIEKCDGNGIVLQSGEMQWSQLPPQGDFFPYERMWQKNPPEFECWLDPKLLGEVASAFRGEEIIKMQCFDKVNGLQFHATSAEADVKMFMLPRLHREYGE